MRGTKNRLQLLLMAGAAGLAMIAGLGVLTGCATRPASGDGAQESPLFDVWREVERGLDGTPQDRGAVELLAEAAFHDAVRVCMARSDGYVYEPAVADDGFQGWAQQLPASELPPLLGLNDAVRPVDGPDTESRGMRVYERLTVAFPQPQLDNPGYRRLSEAKRQAYADALTRCLPDLREFGPDRIIPATALTLKRDLFSRMDEVAARSDVAALLDAYPACMGARGFDLTQMAALKAQGWHATANLIFMEYQPLVEGVRLTRPASDPAVAAVRERERAAAVADAQCRKPAHELAMPHLTAVVRDFYSGHAHDFAALDTEWGRVRGRAERLRHTAGTT